MKTSEFVFEKHCGNCKRPISEHPPGQVGGLCPNPYVNFDY